MQGVPHQSNNPTRLSAIQVKPLKQFITADMQACFSECKLHPLCVGQNIYYLPDQLYYCQLVTLESISSTVNSKLSTFRQPIVSSLIYNYI